MRQGFDDCFRSHSEKSYDGKTNEQGFSNRIGSEQGENLSNRVRLSQVFRFKSLSVTREKGIRLMRQKTTTNTKNLSKKIWQLSCEALWTYIQVKGLCDINGRGVLI